MKSRSTLTAQELAIMKVVWRTGAVTVRDVYETVRAKRPIAYTTVMTMMNILENKGFLRREKHQRAHVYQATRPERTVLSAMIREFVGRVFDGAAQPLLLHLVRDAKLTEKERAELLRLIREDK
jgi:predicted transcriptional regulator